MTENNQEQSVSPQAHDDAISISSGDSEGPVRTRTIPDPNDAYRTHSQMQKKATIGLETPYAPQRPCRSRDNHLHRPATG